MGEQNIGASILAKFQQISNEKELARNAVDAIKPVKECTSSDIDAEKKNSQKRKSEDNRKYKTESSDNSSHIGLSEKEVGITEYVKGSSEGFSGIIKHRFSDFQVHEIDLEGNIIELKSIGLPELPESDTTSESEHRSVLSEEYWKKIDEVVSTESDDASFEIEKEFRGPPIKDSIYILLLKANAVSYCGTKDKRGKTTQRMCIKKHRAEELHRLKLFQIVFGDYSYKHSCLRLGDLSGNKFTIAIRNVEAPDSQINSSLNLLKENGFINYYGLQRFGSSFLSPTFTAGKAILLKDWKKAVESILKPRNGEKCSLQVKKARETWWSTKNAGLALKCLPRNDGSIEGKVLRALKNQGNDQYYNALFAIPRNTMLLYVHAYQSLIWNKVVSKRIKEYGFKPIVGDLILDKHNETIEDNKNCNDEEQESEESSKEEMSEKSIRKQKIKKITAQIVTQIKFEELVFPLPGHDVEYPDNITAEWYSEFLAEDGITFENFKSANMTFSLFGSYRKILAKVDDLTWNISYYNSFDDDLILSDLDKLQNKTLPQQPENSQYKAVILDFKLKPSQYATMLIREVMKCETAVSYHAALTKCSHSSKETEEEVEPDEKKLKNL
uniref:TRUD domain-containing protein n=1 Tax=Rhodnius prolixus TaxID=13249 RepID=T1HC43_RHOPR